MNMEDRELPCSCGVDSVVETSSERNHTLSSSHVGEEASRPVRESSRGRSQGHQVGALQGRGPLSESEEETEGACVDVEVSMQWEPGKGMWASCSKQ